MCNFQIYALRVELADFSGAIISLMRLAPSLPVNTARHVITFGTRHYSRKNLNCKVHQDMKLNAGLKTNSNSMTILITFMRRRNAQ